MNYLTVLSSDEKLNKYSSAYFIQKHNGSPHTNDRGTQCGLEYFELRKHAKENDKQESTTTHDKIVLIDLDRLSY